MGEGCPGGRAQRSRSRALSHAGQALTAGTVCRGLRNWEQARKTTAATGTEAGGSRPEQDLGQASLPETDLGKSKGTTLAPQQKREELLERPNGNEVETFRT